MCYNLFIIVFFFTNFLSRQCSFLWTHFSVAYCYITSSGDLRAHRIAFCPLTPSLDLQRNVSPLAIGGKSSRRLPVYDVLVLCTATYAICVKLTGSSGSPASLLSLRSL